jgi:thiol-disulfide isomerase/thioredoxin
MRMIRWIAIVIAVASLTACNSEVNINNLGPGQAPDFELENIAGGTTRTADLKGKVSVVDIWATWCQPCLAEIPRFNRLYDEYRNKDVQIVGITVVSPYDDIVPTAKKFGMKYTILVGDDAVVEGFGGVIGWPTTFVLTKDWKIYSKYVGAREDKEARIRQDIETLLNRREPL